MIIKKPPLALSALLLTALTACQPTPQQSTATHDDHALNTSALPHTNILKIYNWSDYVDPATLKFFEQQYQVRISYDVYDSDETLEAKMLSGRSGYDLVGPSNAFIGRQIKAGAYLPLDKALIPNYEHINPELLKLMASVDPENRYAVPYFWGVNTFAINESKVKKILGNQLPENQWDLVFNPAYTTKLKKCGISYLDSPSEMFPMALNYLKRPPASDKVEDIEAAAQLLQKNAPNVKRFTSSGYIDDLARGDICVAVGFGGDLNIAKRRAQEAKRKYQITVMMPKEGVGVWVDSLAIPKDAENILNAYRYINHVLDPQIAAQNGNYVTYAPSSTPAKDLMDAEYRDEQSIFPSDEDLQHSFIMVPLSPDMLKIMSRSWQNIKSKK